MIAAYGDRVSKLRTGVVGVGALGQHHLRWYSRLEGSELVGLYDTDSTRAAELAAKHSTVAFDSLESLAEQIECASVVVPTSDHYAVARVLIEHGVHCLIEKPVTATYDQGLTLKRMAVEKGVKLAVGQIERFNPAVQALVDLNVQPSFIEAHRLAAFDPRGTDVAVILDLMIHDIDLTLMLMASSIADIQAAAVAVISDKPDIANARLTFDNGAVANLTASRISLGAMRKLRIFQKSGYYSLDLAKRQADLYNLAEPGQPAEGMRIPLGSSGKDVVYRKCPDSGLDMLGAELGSFLEAVAEGHDTVVPMDQGLEALRVALEVERIGLESANKVMEASTE